MNRRLLILTDNTALGDVLQDRFQELGFAVMASAPDQGAQRVQNWGRPDAVLLDLPGALADAAGWKTRFTPSPVLIALCVPGEGQRLPDGVDAAVGRPVEFEDLASTVELRLAAVPEPDAGHRQTRKEIQPFTAEVSHAETGRRVRYDRQGVKMLSLDLGGAAFESLTDFQEGADLTLWLPVPNETKRLRLQAQVRWCKRKGVHAIVGCQFEAPVDEDLRRLDRILEAHRKP